MAIAPRRTGRPALRVSTVAMTHGRASLDTIGRDQMSELADYAGVCNLSTRLLPENPEEAREPAERQPRKTEDAKKNCVDHGILS
jgi:hypothetical protein